MKFKLDENLPLEVAFQLRELGFDAETVWDEHLSGADDQTVSNRAHTEGRVLITLDLDFANVQAYPPEQHSGIVVLRIKTQDKPSVLAYVEKMVAVLERRDPVGELWIVERDRVRFRTG